MLLAGMSLGTAWAIRGQFGHEQGAAWAGAIGALSIVVMANRADWYAKVFAATLASAIGWGIGGIMSYGMVVGYGRDTAFSNVYYGLLMLFVIGSLYGYIGGGLFGLALTHSSQRPIKWHQLLVEMVVLAIVFYFFMIEQFGWLMTPPRSELWAACLGSAVALTWYMVRHHCYAPIRVAVLAGLGGGFGFAFGNFLQVMGNLTSIHFNFWNVMEYSLGFFGGVGMAYGTFTTDWETTEQSQKKSTIWFPLIMILLLIPCIVWQQSFEIKELENTFSNIATTVSHEVGSIVVYVAIGLVLILTAIGWQKYYATKTDSITYKSQEVYIFFLAYWGLYIIFSLLITGAFMSGYRIEQYLYIANWLLVALFIRKVSVGFYPQSITLRQWGINLGLVFFVIALLAFALINSHGELPNAQKRFGKVIEKNEP